MARPGTAHERDGFFRKQLVRQHSSTHDDGEEFNNLDYTPCINREPIDFSNDLRVRRQGRKLKILTNITMYNEDSSEMERTLKGLSENLDDLEAAGVSWEEFACSIVVDGRAKCSDSVLTYMQKELKMFDPELVQLEYNHADVTMHIFERTVQLLKHKAQKTYYRPLQLIFALKELNGGKLNSHLWFFNAFCRQLTPKYTFLLDVGTQPRARALSKLFTSMEADPQIGGCCGEIAVRNPHVTSLLESAQHFEYKVSHVLDKSMEDVFGYISVLPGAFSAYRWEAIDGTPLSQYFYVEENSVKEMGAFMANMYLAEDRVLCFELVAKRNQDWTLHYEAGAVADTDVPDTILELIKQRRRWLNGAFFSLAYYVSKFPRITRDSAHSWGRKLMFYVQFLYQLSAMILNWFTVGSLYLSFTIVYFMAFESIPGFQDEFKFIFNVGYFFLTILQFLVGLGGKANNTHSIYWVCAILYGIVMAIALGLSMWHLFGNAFNVFVVFAAIIAFGSYVFGAVMHGEVCAILSVVVQYLFMLPCFVNMFTIYSFCNMHDISWGTKEGNLSNSRVATKVHSTVAQRLEALVKAKDLKQTPGQRLLGAMGRAAAAARDAREAKDDLMDVAAMAAMARDEEETAKNKAVAKAKREKETKELEEVFAGFRTRLVTAWVFSNWLYVSFIVSFGFLQGYAIGVAGAILWTLTYRVTGSILYVGHRAGKTCCRVCCRCMAMYVCCCCCRNKDLKKRVRPKKDKYKFGNMDTGSHKLLEVQSMRQPRYSTGNPSGGGDVYGSDESLDRRPSTGRSRSSRPSSVRSSRSRRSRSSGRHGRGTGSGEPVVDLSGDLAAATAVSSTIMARAPDGSRPGTTRRPRTGRTSAYGSDSDSSSSSGSGSSSSGSGSSSDSDDDGGRSRAVSRGRVRTPGRTVVRSATSNAPLTARMSGIAKPARSTSGDREDLSSEEAGGSRAGSTMGRTASDRSGHDALSNLQL